VSFRILAQLGSVMKTHFQQFATDNRWANARLYHAALALSDADYRRNVGELIAKYTGV
jgi:uncharacterized damage-inducible protein DinB